MTEAKKSRIISVIRKLLRSKYSSWFKKIISKLHKQIILEQEESNIFLKKLIDGQTVLSGIFKGMKYPELISRTAICPMIVGSYERELYPAIERLLRNNYKEILDVGCAEGYYAVGMALKTGKDTTVWAYDIDPKALISCQEMAKANGVENKMVFKSACTPKELASFKFTNGLVMSDCEGYENELFTAESVKNLANCDLIIELHEFKIPGVAAKLINLFNGSHSCVIVRTDNYFKHVTRNQKEYRDILKGINYRTQMEALQEFRPGPMRWLICERKSGRDL